ncbi:Flavin monooxygenase FMO [Corchorus capsularis]|uniref:Flavin-containing monooxygenase n=1 Tax=Corchorus capsularis TaxID=210143 RepID=A0A1R3IBM1_COCAP|nr:Flavin monooxygenase FMO [Corchorus capsularis]
MAMDRQVAIVGAGVSGLIACKYVLSKGFRPIVFETEGSIGGVWNKMVETTTLQTPKDLYVFSDFPWPSEVKEPFPARDKVVDYIESYAKHFDLLKHIKFNTKVVSVDFEGTSEEEMQYWSLWNGNGEPFSNKGKWKVIVEDLKTQSSEIYQVDFVILCVGQFSGVANIPDFPPKKGPEVFNGKVVHAMDLAAMDDKEAAEFIKDKKIIIVGFQKSALDIAMECAAANGVEKPCTVMYRTAHWKVPRNYPWFVSLAFTRYAELMAHKPGEGFFLSLLATILTPLRWFYAKRIENGIKKKLNLEKFGMVPNYSLLQDVSSCMIATLPDKFYDKVDEGKIKLKKAPNFSFCPNGILVDGETTPVEADVVIFATGYRGENKLRNIFVSQTFQKLIAGTPDAAMPIYRECIQPRIPQLAVIGFSEGFSTIWTSEMRCRWLAELLDGTFKVPSIKEMEKDVAEWDEKLKLYCGSYYRKKCIGGLQIWHNDQLCKDMGWNPKRKKGFFAELFENYGPLDYASPS